jgi:hypothetical protein
MRGILFLWNSPKYLSMATNTDDIQLILMDIKLNKLLSLVILN